MQHETREAWLTSGIEALWPYLYETDTVESMPAARISVGFPHGPRGTGTHRHGQVFRGDDSTDGTTEIFISPEMDDPADVLPVLAHMLIHASLGTDEGHGKNFGAASRALGLTGKLTDTQPSSELAASFRAIADELGPYPHASLNAREGGGIGGAKKQGTRMLKIECDSCGMVARTTAKWLDNPGLPTCACGGAFVDGTRDE